jgi:ligand-binding sensor domain-containing protein/DNA-binding CsgD family transcriptional regulator
MIRMYKKLTYIIILILFPAVQLLAEIINIGVPHIKNYTRREYHGGTQNWSIEQDRKGFMYFANNDGLLVFDGEKWQLHRMPNLSIVRSVYKSKNGQIYVGAYNDLGKMNMDEIGKPEFISLKKYIPEAYHNFDDIWNINSFEEQLVFQSYNCAFFFRNDSTVNVLKAPNRFQSSFHIRGRLFFNDIEQGLLEYRDNVLIPLKGCENIRGEEIWSVLPYRGGNELMIFTLNKGVFIYDGLKLEEWNVPINSTFRKNQIFSATVIQDNYIAVGTVQEGVFITDEYGRLIQHINRQKGLQNNTILKTFADREGNLWLGLDNGIDYLNINSPITFLQESDGIGAGYTSIIHKGKLYLGTNQGLFYTNWSDGKPGAEFKLINGTKGQVWYLGLHDDILLCGHNNGTFEIDGENAQQISRVPGAWKFHTLKRYPEYLVGGTYSGISLYQKQNGKWVFKKMIDGFNESFRVFEEDENGDLWMSHGFKGVYRVKPGESLNRIESSRYFTTADALPTNFNLNVFKIKGKIIVTSNVGIFEFNAEKDKFEYSTYFNQLLHPIKDIAFLKEDKTGNIWYVVWDLGKAKTGVFRIQEDLSYKQVSAPFGLLTGQFISGFESIYIYSGEHIFFGTELGFAHYSPLSNFYHSPDFNAYINRADAVYLDSTFFYGRNFLIEPTELETQGNRQKLKHNLFSFPFKDNAFRFSFTTPAFDNQENIEYSFLLEGNGNKWSTWSSTSFTEYTNLPPGDYTFNVKARNQLGIESSTDSIRFVVRPPWYKSIYAYLFYSLIFIGLILLVIWIILKRIEISKRKERLKHLRSYRQKEQEYIKQALIAEKKIINLKNDKLKIEMIHRDKELANQTMDLIRKNKFLVKIKEELEKLKKSSAEESVRDKIASLINKIDKDIDHKKQWEIFETAFDEVHEDFLSRLKEKYPNLTPKELRLCAYLRMNISTKEIAPLMNISIRGVEICRYRLRKKMNIDREQNLTKTIIDL